MLLEIYVLLIVLASVACYLAIARHETHKLSAAAAVIFYALVAISSGNIEVVSYGETLTFSNEYLFIIWAAMSLLNILFLIVGPAEELAEAGNRSLSSVTSKGGR